MNGKRKYVQILPRFSSYSCLLNIIQPMREHGVFPLCCMMVCGVQIFLKAIYYVLDNYGREIGTYYTWNTKYK